MCVVSGERWGHLVEQAVVVVVGGESEGRDGWQVALGDVMMW